MISLEKDDKTSLTLHYFNVLSRIINVLSYQVVYVQEMLKMESNEERMTEHLENKTQD